MGAFDRRRVAGVGVRDARRRPARGQPVEVGLPTRAQAAAGQPDVTRLPRRRTSSSRCWSEHLGSLRACGSSAGSSSRARARSRRRPRRSRSIGPAAPPPGSRAAYVVGADGVRSRGARQLGIASEGDGAARGTARGAVPRPALGARWRPPLRHLLPRRRGRSFIPAASRPLGVRHGPGRRGRRRRRAVARPARAVDPRRSR